MTASGRTLGSVRGKDTHVDDVGGLAGGHARELGVGDELDGVGTTSVLGDASVLVVGFSGRVVVLRASSVTGRAEERRRTDGNVLEDGSELDGTVDFGLLLGGESNALQTVSARYV